MKKGDLPKRGHANGKNEYSIFVYTVVSEVTGVESRSRYARVWWFDAFHPGANVVARIRSKLWINRARGFSSQLFFIIFFYSPLRTAALLILYRNANTSFQFGNLFFHEKINIENNKKLIFTLFNRVTIGIFFFHVYKIVTMLLVSRIQVSNRLCFSR